MAQSLDQIIAELDASYNPSRQSINDRINGLQPAQDADLAGLEVQKQNAFGDITNGARARGMGFSGIPLAEQGKYVGGTFLPAVAKVKQSYQEGRNSLVDALNNMNIDQRKTAMSIRETQQNRDFEAEQARLTREAADRAAAASNRSMADYFGGGAAGGGGNNQQTPTKPGPPKTDPVYQKQWDFAKAMGNKGPTAVVSDFRAARTYYEKTGNQNDLIKMQIYKTMYPDLLGTATWKNRLASF
jgi:hypothetical protein